MKQTISIGLLGLGTVGRGVYKLLTRENAAMQRRLGGRLNVKKVLVKDVGKARPSPVPAEVLTSDPADILGDPDIDIVIELIGGVTAAKDIVELAIKGGKSVVTANKELLAQYGGQLLADAEEAGVDLFFEASVGGGIPIIAPLKNSLVGNRVEQVMGIVNGTTNYILSAMADGLEFFTALARAQELGYAEADPAADVSGADAASKIAILASIAFNSRVRAADVYTEGIDEITQADVTYARELGYRIKLIALAKREGDALDVRVHPTMIPSAHPLAAVSDVYNAIFVVGDAVGELMFYGRGAGSLPTASAVVGDVFAAAMAVQYGGKGRSGCTCYSETPIKPIERVRSRYYILMQAFDQPGVLAQVAGIFGAYGVSLEIVLQKETSAGAAEVVFMTHLVEEGGLRSALAELERLECVSQISSVIRVESDEHA